jgi:2-oxoglutarate dehydrogenase complex dehydrogenase (E1) component-like enzyme
MGAWSFISRRLPEYKLLVAARPESGSPAAGSVHLHNLRQRKLLKKPLANAIARVQEPSAK